LTHRLAFSPAAALRHRLFAIALAAVFASAALGGCAGQMAYRDAQQLAAGDRPDAALLKYREALVADPDNLAYRTAYLLARQKMVAGWLEQAAAAKADGRRPDAERLYRAVLEIDAANTGARDGLAALRREVANEQSLNEAAEALRAGRTSSARKLAAAVLCSFKRSPGA